MTRPTTMPRPAKPRSTTVVDRASFALLRSTLAGTAPHPALGGANGRAARARLIASGLVQPDGAASAAARRLVEPIRAASAVVRLDLLGARPGHRVVWIGDRVATAATPRPDGTLALTSLDVDEVGAELVCWLGVRPLPSPARRSPQPLDLAVLRHAVAAHVHDPRRAEGLDVRAAAPGTGAWAPRSAWLATATVDSAHRLSLAALDSGSRGWWLHRSPTELRAPRVTLQPVDVTAVYVALARLIRGRRNLSSSLR